MIDMIKYKEEFLKRAIELAEGNIDKNGGPFGAVIVKDGKIIAEGVNEVAKSNDPTSHAEINAIRKACEKMKNFNLEKCEIYSSCEPCPMCLGAIYWAGIYRVYFAIDRRSAAKAGFDDDFIYNEINLPFEKRKIKTKYIHKKEAEQVFEKWIKFGDKIKY